MRAPRPTARSDRQPELIGWIFVKEEKGSRRRHYFTPDEQIARV